VRASAHAKATDDPDVVSAPRWGFRTERAAGRAALPLTPAVIIPASALCPQGSTEQGHDDFETEGRDSFYHKNLYSWSSGQDTVQ